MKIEIKGNVIILRGENWGDNKHNPKYIRIYSSSDEKGQDYFSFSICQGGMEMGVLPSVSFYKDDTVVQNNLSQGRQIIR